MSEQRPSDQQVALKVSSDPELFVYGSPDATKIAQDALWQRPSNQKLPYEGKCWNPWPHGPPEGWPEEYAAWRDFEVISARLVEAERECREWLAACAKGQDEQVFRVVRSILAKVTADVAGAVPK